MTHDPLTHCQLWLRYLVMAALRSRHDGCAAGQRILSVYAEQNLGSLRQQHSQLGHIAVLYNVTNTY